jgi:hypothetical protein
MAADMMSRFRHRCVFDIRRPGRHFVAGMKNHHKIRIEFCQM